MTGRWNTATPPGAQPSWADGYVVDAPYFEPTIGDLTPAWLSMSSVLHGQPPLDTTRPFTWVDLGCGGGVHACAVAAANPNMQVWGCDINPAHVDRGRRLTTAAGLTNCTFDEATFGMVATDRRLGPAEADVIVLHGVYSWVSKENQHHITEIIQRRLRPGGLVFVSYEVATGWSSMVPLAEAMRLQTEADWRRSDLAFPDAAAAVQRLVGGAGANLQLGTHESTQLAALSGANPLYGAHEYLGAHFEPLLFDDVAQNMAEARCSFVGSLDAVDHLSAYWVPPSLGSLVLSSADVGLRELMRDLATERPLRRELFRRGLSASTAIEQGTWLAELRLVGLGRPFVDTPVNVPIGSIGLSPQYYVPLVKALESGPLDLARVRALHPGWSAADAIGALCLLAAGGYAAPVVDQTYDDRAIASARRLNEILVAENRQGRDHGALVAPAVGGAVTSEYFEMLVLGAVWDGRPADVESLVDYAFEELARQNRAVREAGALVADPAEARRIVHQRVARALERIDGAFVELGIG